MKISKALITLADPRQRTLALQTLIDQDGSKKTALKIILNEAISAGIEKVGMVICPGDEVIYSEAAGEFSSRVEYITQSEPKGYAQAILLGKDFVGDDPFLHMVGDHLYVSNDEIPCARQVVEIAEKYKTSVSSVQATRENQITSFGAVGGRLEGGNDRLYRVDRVLEKPTPTEAELSILVPGLRVGFFLCFFGIHALQPSIFPILEETTKREGVESKFLSTALNELSQREKLLAFETDGNRYDIGSEYGLLFSQLALAFSGKDNERVMNGLIEMLATRPSK